MTRLVVVGNGMAGIAAVEQILKHAPTFAITVFGDETHVNYNRILLSSVLAGEQSADDIVLNPIDWYQRHAIDLHLGTRVIDVDADGKTVTSDDGGRRRTTSCCSRPAARRGCRRSPASTSTVSSCSARSTTRAACWRGPRPA